MQSELRRGYVLAAATLVLVFQFIQFIKSQNFILGAGTLNPDKPGVELPTLNDSPERTDGWDHALASPFEATDSQPADNREGQSDVHVDIRSALENLKKRVRRAGDPPPPPPAAKGLQFDPQRFDYRRPAEPTKYTLPQPKRTKQSTVILCLSSRDNFKQRNAIRESWAKGNDNVYFVIGGPVPGHFKDMNMDNPLSTSSLLFLEQTKFGDIIDTIHPDTYKSLPYKLHMAMRWMMKNIDNVEWIVKVDDDCVVRVKLLQFFVLRHMNPNHAMVIGTISVGARPHRTGKWAEDPHFRKNQYPPWAFGSAGYVVSRPVAQYVADNDHYYYQGEDAGLGIWLSQSPLQVTFIDSPELRKDEGCVRQLYIIGHDLNPQAIRECFRKLGDDVPQRSHVVAFSAGRKDQFPEKIRNPN